MTREDLIKRLESLKAGEITLVHRVEAAKNDLTAQRGAIQECQFWIEQLDAKKVDEPAPSYPTLKAVDQ